MKAEKLMVDGALTHIEQTEAYQESAEEQLARPAEMGAPCGPPEKSQPNGDEHVGERLKEPVPERVDLQVLEAVGRIAGSRDHMVPLQQLMQDDPVEKAAETEAEEDAG